VDHQAVLNLGVRPTVDAHATLPRLEVHLLDFSGDLYGQELEVEFVRILRPERKFSSLDALREQIARDAQTARDALD
jgi:riboflavin kinase/FMN adenylyltransferase